MVLKIPARPALRRAGVLAAAIAAVFAAAQVPALRGEALASTAATASTAPVAAAPREPAASGMPRFADVIERVRPAVVSIATERELRAGPGAVRMQGRATGPDGREVPLDDPRMRELFRQFFGGALPDAGAPQRAQGAGSGFVVDPAGWIVTNRHVVADATTVTVTLQDGRHFPATVKGEDEKTDLALLKVEAPQPLAAVSFGDAAQVRVGDWVIAIGNPFGLGGTATAGIVSARGRDIHSGPYDDYLQIDAPINQGNSGGPVFDEQGRVIGVNTAIYSPNGGSVGIGFAIPADTVADVVAQLRERGSVARGWLGVEIQPVSDEIAQGLGLDAARGALVAAVEPGSPAAAAGLAPGDVVLRFGDAPVAEVRDLTRAVAHAAAGRRAGIVVWRDGAQRELDARIESTPGAGALAQSTTPRETTGGGLGLSLAPLEPGDGEGARVLAVRPGSPAAQDGLAEGDVIRQVGARAVHGPADVGAAVDAARKAGRPRVVMLVERDGNRGFVALPLS